MDTKIEQLYKYCKVFLDSDKAQLLKFSAFSIYPTFLFDGYPGTGKSSVASIIYERLKRDYNIDIHRLNIDELISHNFGESSSNLRAYFEARNKEVEKNNSHCFIIMDEVDSFTISRGQNHNESIKRILLTFNTIIDELVRSDQIYKYIIIATTNVKNSIDTSVLRRFYFNEDFNIILNEGDFNLFVKELSDMAGLCLNETLIKEIYQLYTEKKYTLGEVKSVISKAYIDTLTSDHRRELGRDDFCNRKTFHEITCSQ